MIKKREQIKSQGTEVTGRGLLSSAGDALLTSEVNSLQSSNKNAPNFNNRQVEDAIKIGENVDQRTKLRIGVRKQVQDTEHKLRSQTSSHHEEKPRSRGLTTAGSDMRRGKREKTSSRRQVNDEIPERAERKSSRREHTDDNVSLKKPSRRTSGGQAISFDAIKKEVN